MQNTVYVNATEDPRLEVFINLTKTCYTDVDTVHSRVLETSTDAVSNVSWCPRTFDGFLCWDPTPPARTALQSCPDFIVGFDPRRLVFKTCSANGTWYLHPEGRRAWTNYTTCVDVEDLNFRTFINNMYVAGYSVSVAALVISMMIFIYFKTLQCTRIRIHMHLFLSFSLNGLLWILWYKSVVSNVEVVQANHVWCQILHVITHYFMVSSYMWMFCESLHLHIALIVVFIKDEMAMRWFIAVGWGLSLFIITLYSGVRYYTSDVTARCWMDEVNIIWIITVPVLLSLIASFVFLINIVRVLVTKLPAINNQSPAATRKAVRATLILIPLFGLHFMLLPLRPLADAPGEKLYQIVSALLTSLQGLCVAVLFCFTNHEVVSTVRTHLARYILAHQVVAMTGMTAAGESVGNTRENFV